jgi:polar amino acid transport system permease protein
VNNAKPFFDWQFAWEVLPRLLPGLWVTLEATVLGMALALVLGLVWTLCRRADNFLLSRGAHWIVEFVRSTPLLIQLYFLFYVLPSAGVVISPLLTGLLALGVHYSSYTTEVYRAGIEAVPRGQWDASSALGFSRAHIWRAIILPQAIPRVLPVLGNYFIAMFKDTPLLAAITVAELLQNAKIIGAESFRYLEPLTLVGVIFLILSLIASRLVFLLEKRYVVRH